MRLRGLRRRQRGLSLLEFTLTVTVVLLILAVAMVRIAELRIDVERMGVQQAEAAMRTALALKFAQLYTRGQLDEVPEWAGANPLPLLEGEPALSAREDRDMAAAGPGDWYYDAAAGEVVYDVAYPEGVAGETTSGRWRVVVIGSDSRPRGLDLETVEAITWRQQ